MFGFLNKEQQGHERARIDLIPIFLNFLMLNFLFGFLFFFIERTRLKIEIKDEVVSVWRRHPQGHRLGMIGVKNKVQYTTMNVCREVRAAGKWEVV